MSPAPCLPPRVAQRNNSGSKRRLAVVAVMSVMAVVGSVRAQTAAPPDRDIDLIRHRLVARYAAGNFADGARYLATQRPDGSWPDIDYADRSLNWSPQKHVDRLKEIAIAYRNQKSPLHGSAEARDAVARGLAFWYRRKPGTENWWSNEIGQQLTLEPILVLMAGDLPAELVTTGATYLHDPVQLASYKFTGQNLVWCAGEQFVRGVLRDSEADLAAAVHVMEGADVVTSDVEGIQYDHSFHQHGPQLYVGGYGLNFLKDGTDNALLVAGTRFAYATDKIDVLSDYLLDGARLMVRGKMLDNGAIGREIARPGAGQEAVGLLPVLDNMGLLKPDKKADYDALKAHIAGTGASSSFVGHKHFWNSDFTVHHRAAYYASVKMVSARTYGTETINGENLKGYWLPFGVTYVARRGDEYVDIFPVWDWAHLPGVTSPDQVPRFLSHVDQLNTFVGGVSDGRYGAAAMKVDVDKQTSIHAHKAWFFFDDEFVALGAGISSTGATAVSTTLNQSLQEGGVIVDGHSVAAGRQPIRDVSWVLHDGIGYVFPEKATAVVSTGPRSGSWSDINSLQARTPVSKSVFALWLDHGVRPSGASYQYIVVPDIDGNRLATYAAHPAVRILANTTEVQAVQHERLGISQIIFYAPGRLTLGQDLTIGVDRPCMVLVAQSGAGMKIVASAPSGPAQLHVSLERAAKSRLVTFELRGGPSLGASHTANVASF